MQKGIELVSVAHVARAVDFSTGEQLGPRDHIVEWTKPIDCHSARVNSCVGLPETMKMCEFVIEIRGRDRGKLEAVIVTTMTDAAIPQKEIADLY